MQTLKGPNVAIVGARRASPLGLELSKRFARGLAQSGLTVASGLALGVDAAAHIGALEAARSTIAVLPCGIDKVYPKCHNGLAELIEDNGAVISEFYPGMPPRSALHRRNRTLSGCRMQLW